MPEIVSVASVSIDPPVRKPLRGLIASLLLTFAALGVAFPVVVAIVLGEAPYRQIFVSYPGIDVAIVTTILLASANTASLVSVGAMVHLLFLRDAPAQKARTLPQGFEIHVLQVASGAWALCSAVLIVFEALDANGAPLERLAIGRALPFLWEASNAPKAWTISLFAALIVFFASYFADRWTGLLIPLWVAAIGILAPVVTGQVLVGPDHDFGGDAAVFYTIATSAFFGAVIVSALKVASGRLIATQTLRRLLILGTVALPVIVFSEVILGVFKLAGSPVTASLTGWFILISGACLLVHSAALTCAWWWVRTDRLEKKRLTILLGASGTAVIAWVATGVAMTRQPPPQYFVPTSIQQVFMGFDVPDPPTLAVLFTQWRPNVLFLGIAAVAITIYLLSVRVLHRRGDSWPAGRTLAWILGWTVVVFVTNSGFGKYSAPDFGVHMIVHMALNMLAPGLLVLGGVITLLLRATRTKRNRPAALHDWITWMLHWRVLQFVYNPLVVFFLFVGSYYGLYFTGIFGEYMRFHWAHQLMNLHFLIVGYLYYSLIIGVDRPPRPLPHIGKLGYVLAAMPFHAFFGVILMTSNVIIAENFYRYLDLPWADLPAQQYLAGGIAWAGGEIPLMIVIVILGIQWSRQDAREANRKDRHLDTGRDDEFAAYNDMLQRLTDRETTRPGPRPALKKGPNP